MDASLQSQRPDIGFNGVKKTVTKANELALIKHPAIAEIIPGCVKKSDVHEAQISAQRSQHSRAENGQDPAVPAHGVALIHRDARRGSRPDRA
jgi:hypothetical protein